MDAKRKQHENKERKKRKYITSQKTTNTHTKKLTNHRKTKIVGGGFLQGSQNNEYRQQFETGFYDRFCWFLNT